MLTLHFVKETDHAVPLSESSRSALSLPLLSGARTLHRLLFAAVWGFSRYRPPGFVAYLLALLPAIPIVGVLVIIGLYLAEEKDEFQRVLVLQSMIWSIAGVLATTTVWGLLEMFLKVPHLALYLGFPLFWFFVGVSGCILRVRYR